MMLQGRMMVRWAPVATAALLVAACGDDSTGSGGSSDGATGTVNASTAGSPVASAAVGTGGAGGDFGSGGSDVGGGGIGGFDDVPADCDPLVPTQCGFPFPSNLWTIADPSTPTGLRVKFGAETLPVHREVGAVDPAIVADSDGFSPGQAPMTHLPGATVTGLPTQHDIDASLDAGSPTILLDVERGQLVPHFAELDMTAADDGDRAFLIRPVVRLRDGARYIVAIRGVVDGEGEPLAPTDGFRALRDDIATADGRIEGRRALYDDLFAQLDDVGVGREDLQIAWDYTTASTADHVSRLLHMRDVALDLVGEQGPTYVVDEVVDDPNPMIRRRIEGRFTVPLFLDSPDPGGGLVYGDDGLPAVQGEAEYPFIVQIPISAVGGSAGLLQNGHGLLGSRYEGRDGCFAAMGEQGTYVTVAVDMIGMASADEPTAVAALIEDPLVFRPFVDRQLQGMVNQLLVMRMMSGRFTAEPLLTELDVTIDPTRRFYRGDSQGGIMGTTYMAVSTDVERGLLGEPGAPYNLLLSRSVDFEPFFNFFRVAYGSQREIQIMLGLLQMLWDRIEPTGFLPFVTTDPLPNTPPHRVLLHAAVGDHQVTPLGAHLIARAIGARLLEPAARDVWGIEHAEGQVDGSALVEFDFGELVPPLPDSNAPTTADESTDPHDWVCLQQPSVDQGIAFFETGIVTNYCEGSCDPQ